ncbi:MAG: hypothetical protein D6732_06330 [Methanobacteriota archaeon]|nr:MAG: hypothetical protein D6732_06330 [Euryarchaeota archaeon]
MGIVEERVTNIEKYIRDLAYLHIQTERKLAGLSEEMKEFKDEMREFKDEMREFKDEMREFKDEMKEFKDFTERNIKSLNQKWGELANRLGTVVEDIILPDFPNIIVNVFKADYPEDIMINRRKRMGKRSREFDIIAVSGDKVFLNETKTTPKDDHIENFATFIHSGEFFEWFPEFKGKQLIPIFSSIGFNEEHVRKLTEKRIYAVQPNPRLEVLNFKEVNEASSTKRRKSA